MLLLKAYFCRCFSKHIIKYYRPNCCEAKQRDALSRAGMHMLTLVALHSQTNERYAEKDAFGYHLDTLFYLTTYDN